MMRALFSGVTGLRSHQTKMDVIGNNISNVNTLGYKKSTANFADIYSETVSPSSAPSANNGGINARQVGLGVQLTSIAIKHNPGAAQYTGNTLDLAISGDGFFAVRTNADGRERYTRAGNLSISSNGSLVTSNGNFVQCFKSTYQAGTAGVHTTNGFLSADGEKKSAPGFSQIEFLPDLGRILNTASGTYTVELADDNQSVRLMKNGIAIGDTIPIQDTSTAINPATEMHESVNAITGFKQNTTYLIDLTEQGLGQIRFTTEGHTITRNVESLTTDHFGNGTLTIPPAVEDALNPPDATTTPLATGNYEFKYNAQTNTVELLGPDKNPAGTVTVTLENPPGVTATLPPFPDNAGAAVPSGTIVKITSTVLGEITFQARNSIPAGEGPKAAQDLVNSLSFSVSAGRGEGPDKFQTALASLNGLLTGASVSVTNNDAFQSAATRGDMIINQDLFENVSINEEGAVIGQLKVNTDGTTLQNEAGIVGAEDMAAGEKVVLGYVALATFANAEGLEKVGTNLYEMTANSGRVMYYTAGTGGTGAIAPSSLEMSNVDLSEEMVNMITTQRGFQANSRIITTTDTMLEELINLKR